MANAVLYGFENLSDRFSERVSDSLIPVINTAIERTMAEHNRQLDAFLALFADRTTDYSRRYKTPVANRLQPMDENGRARPIRVAGYYDIAFPMQEGGTAWGQTYQASLKNTVQDVNNRLSGLLFGDIMWMRDHIFAALFANTSWTYTDEEHGALTVKGLANGDADTYMIQTGAQSGVTDTHYLAQANAIDDSNDPYGAIHDELVEHPENGGKVIALIPTGLKAATKALTSFYPISDPNIDAGPNAARLIGSMGAAVPGVQFGYHDDGVFLVEWPILPAGYIIAVTTDGDRPLAMREDTVSQLVGFNRVAERNDYPYFESQYLRKAGFGAQNRVGAVVYRVGNGSYAVPTGYSSPMP
jgi:hypothetical protein